MSFEPKDKDNEFIENLDFIKWVNSGFQHQNVYWLEVKAGLKDKDAFDNAVSLIQGLEFDSHSEISQNRKEKLFDRINLSIDSQSDATTLPKAKIVSFRFLAAVAATLLVLISAFWFFDNSFTMQTNFAQSENIELPDQSLVHLNVGSNLQYQKRSFNKKRHVRLDGEAYFKVQKGESFVVESSVGTVEVLGTSFNVYSRNNVMEVVCHTGKVRVVTKDKKSEAILTASMSCRIENGILTKGVSKTDGNWTSGMYSYNNASLDRVLDDIERQYNITILRTDEVKSQNYTGFFESDQLDEALQSVLWPLQLQYETTGESEISIIKK